MTARKTRIMLTTIDVITLICGIVGFVLLFMSAAKSDYYAGIQEAVPGNADLKMAFGAFLALMVAIVGIEIIKNGDFDAMYDLKKVPVYCTNEVSKKLENIIFAKQINDALGCYYNHDWGILDDVDKEMNDIAVKSGKERVLAAYTTIYGEIYIITEADRSVTTILFAREY